jgi:succinate dehydrogenase / fumarate reductase cytochrome b subunit
MCVEAAPKSKCGEKSNCGCGGHGHAKTAALNPQNIRTIKFGEEAEQECRCSGGGRCPRHYLAPTGYVLAGFLILHLAVNALALWPGKFQTAVNKLHSLGALLPVLEIGLIAVLCFHIAVGLRLMRRDKLKFITGGHFHGSPMRQWLQRVTAVILLAFILFHVVTLHRWFGGRFDPGNAFSSASHAIWQFWHGHPAGSFPNLLFAQFYLLGIVAAVFHLTNGVATGAEVLGLVSTPIAQDRLWRICIIAAAALLLAGLVAWYAFAVR